MVWLYLVPVPVVAAAVALFWRPLRSFSRDVHAERAREAFKLQRERLELLFLKAAQDSGKPRGLRWTAIDWDDQVLFARERHTGHIAALIGATIQFEAVEGSDMEGLPAVGNLRNASAVFFFQRGHWHTVGKAVFNLNPAEVLERFKNQYERVEEA
jgi:hypothetical protein